MIREPDKKQPSLPGFESPFERNLDPNNRWVKLAEVVPWEEFAAAYYSGMSVDQGTPAKPARLMVGAVILKHRQRWTDEETVLQIQENPYLQFFCGFSGFTLEQPFAPSLFVEIRKRMGATVYAQFEQAVDTKLTRILAKKNKAKQPGIADGDPPSFEQNVTSQTDHVEIVAAPETPQQADNGLETDVEGVEAKPSGKLIIDATVAEQAIRYPTDLGLLNEAQEISERLIDRLLPSQVEAFKKRHGHYPAVVLADGIYGTRDNRRYCKDRGIRFGGKPLGRPRKETETNREELREAKRQRRRDHLERIPIEGKFGQGKNRHGLAKIRAKLADTSASWIRAIFLVMNLNLLVRFFFAQNQPCLHTALTCLLTRMVVWQGLVKDMAGWLRLPQGRPMIAVGAF
ncbi:MAG: transposase [Magnetococcales bacterium]|nr:transposase [Magnetococcales bacterium]NGZ07131.1 transposase [Magnetococcales bacterium]